VAPVVATVRGNYRFVGRRPRPTTAAYLATGLFPHLLSALARAALRAAEFSVRSHL